MDWYWPVAELDEGSRSWVSTSMAMAGSSGSSGSGFSQSECVESSSGYSGSTGTSGSSGAGSPGTSGTGMGMVTPLGVLEEGGTLIIASECEEGVGSEEFRAAQERLVEMGPEKFLASIQEKALADVDEWQTEMQLKPMRVGEIVLYAPNLGDAHAVTGVGEAADISSAIADAMARHGDADVAVIPEGPYVVPFA